MKNISIVVLISLIMTSLISCVGGALTYFLLERFVTGFCVTFIITYIIGWLWNLYLNRKYNHDMAEIEKDNNIALAYQNIELVCTYCNVKNLTRIALNKENTFKCGNCNQENGIKIDILTTRLTKPVIADAALQTILTSVEQLPQPITQNTINTENLNIT